MQRFSEIFTSIVLLALLAVGCTSETAKPPTEVKQAREDTNVCHFSDNSRAPDWLCMRAAAKQQGAEVSAIGIYPKSKRGVSFQRTQAQLNGRAELATQMKVRVAQMIKSHAETTGQGDEETADAVASVTRKAITKETLIGSEELVWTTDPADGTTYSLMALDSKKAVQTAKRAVKTSYKDNLALYQKFLGKKAQEELDAEIKKMAEAEFGG
jgi:hypothetical protein